MTILYIPKKGEQRDFVNFKLNTAIANKKIQYDLIKSYIEISINTVLLNRGVPLRGTPLLVIDIKAAKNTLSKGNVYYFN
ncbi:hypothetical protein Riv7116_2904 [Rivularia sp. PCC 7116]|nr:hypothetical protein Riv7116_2904 [Rivularia sp. PCC 7116]